MLISRFPLSRPVVRPLALAALAFSSIASASATAQSPDAQSNRVTIQSHSASALAAATDAGALPASQTLQLTLTLTPPQDRAAALDQFLADLNDSTSSSYHQWITPADFASTYGATSDQVAAVSAWAQGHGLTVGALSAGGTRLAFTGAAAQVQAAFAVALHAYTVSGTAHYGTPDQPSIPSAIAPNVTAITGLDDLSNSALSAVAIQSTGAAVTPKSLVADATPDAFATAATAIDANTAPILAITSTACTSDYASPQIEQYRTLFRQAAAQGISVIASSGCGVSGSFPASLAEVTAISLTGAANDTDPSLLRPAWQSVPGLPANGLRMEPDLTTPTVSAFGQAIATILTSSDGQSSIREGNLNTALYKLAPIPGLYTQPDAATDTWEQATGLGSVNLQQLIKVFPRGAGMSYTSFSATNYAPTHGQNTTLSSTVTSGTGGAAPTGTVAFIQSGITLANVNLDANGNASLTTNQLPGGSVQVTAVYSGDATYAGSSPAQGPATFSVQPEPSQLSAVASTGNIVGGTFTITVTDTVTLGQPTGAITVSLLGRNYTGTLAPVTATSSAAVVTIPASADTVGTSTVSSTCVTSNNYSCYVPLATQVTVGKATPVLNYSYTPNPPVSGASIALTASLAAVGTAPVPTGNVQFLDNATLLNASRLDSTGATSTTGTVTTASTHVISATYAGDANYISVTSSNPGTTTGKGTTTTALTSSSTTVTAGQSITFAASVTTSATVNSTAPTGTVIFYDGSTAISSPQTLTSGSVSFSTSALAANVTHSVTAIYSGDANYGGSTSAPVVLNKGTGLATTTTAAISSPTNPTYGSVITLSTTVTSNSGGGTPTGKVQFLSGTTVLCTATLTSSTASCTVTSVPSVGPFMVVASYQGDTTFASSTSPVNTVTVAVATATLMASITPTTSIAAGGTGTISATVSLPVAAVTPPTGSITATITGVTGAVYSTPLPGTAGTTTATVSIPLVAPNAGTYSIAVTCTGNSNYMCAPVTIPLTTTGTAGKTTTTVLTISPTIPTAGQLITLTAAVTGAATTPALTGSVLFLDGTKQIGSGAVSATGVATATVTLTGGTAHSLTAVYSGDTNYSTSTSLPVTVMPTTIASGITLLSSATTSLAGNSIVLTAQVGGTSATGLTPTGLVTFYDTFNGVLSQVDTANLGASGPSLSTAIFTTTGLLAGTHNLYAVYAGDTNFNPVQSAPALVINISDYAPLFTPATLTLAQGDSGTARLSISGLDGFSGNISFACTPPANTGITCSFSPDTLSAVTSGSTTLTINTTAAHKPAVAKPLSSGLAGGLAGLAAVLCLVLPGRRRRRMVPTLLLVFLALGITANLGCGSAVNATAPTLPTSGTPFGTSLLTITTAGTVGSNTVRHNLTYQVTVQ